MKPAGISLCMIVRNEEKFLGDCLESVKSIVDEMIVVDTGSTDKTVRIAQSHGAFVAHMKWENDFSKARNAGLDIASRRWIFVLDADEVLTDESKELLLAVRDQEAGILGYYIRCYNLTDDHMGMGAVSNTIIRLFPNSPRIRYQNPIHEGISLDGSKFGMPAQPSDIAIIHRGYLPSVFADRNKVERNIVITEKALRAEPGDPYCWYNYAVAVSGLSGPLMLRGLEVMRELSKGNERGYVPSGLTHLAHFYLVNGMLEQAEEVARECDAICANFPNILFALGKSLALQMKYPEAREAYMRAVKAGAHVNTHLFVDHEIALWKAPLEIGGTYMDQGDFQSALGWFERGLQNRPENVPLRLNLARSYERLNLIAQAETEFKQVWYQAGDEFTTIDYAGFLARCGRYTEAGAVLLAPGATVSPEALEIAMRSIEERHGPKECLESPARA